MNTTALDHFFDMLASFQFRVIATAVWFSVLGIASAIIWYRRLRRIRARNRSAMPGVGNSHLLSPGGEEAEAWVSTRRTIRNFRNGVSVVLCTALEIVHAAVFAIATLIFIVLSCLPGQKPSDRAAGAAGALLFGALAWWFANRARSFMKSRC